MNSYLKADVVVADLSTSNKNAFYELGVRHALRPFTTVVVAEDGIKTFPFDISHVAVRQYHHLGEDIGFDEVMRFRGQLTNAICEILKKDPHDNDSPVYAFLNGLTPPALAAAVQAKVQEVVDIVNTNGQNKNKIPGDTGKENSPNPDTALNSQTHSALMQQVDEAQKRGDWITAKTLLSAIRQMMKGQQLGPGDNAVIKIGQQQEDPYILQRLALATYKSKFPTEKDALTEAQQLLGLLSPGTCNDTETLGLWGAIHKRLWDLTKDISFLERIYSSLRERILFKE